jgi:hypothetical protein
MSERNTTWLRFGLAIIASIYAIFGAAIALQLVHAVLITGSQESRPGLLDGFVPLLIAFGLLTHRPWARIMGLVVSGFLLFVGIIGLGLCLGHVFDLVRADGGLLVDRPGFAVGLLILVIAFAVWQWWVLSSPSIQAMFCSSPNRP